MRLAERIWLARRDRIAGVAVVCHTIIEYHD
jgi:hypothetical protein